MTNTTPLGFWKDIDCPDPSLSVYDTWRTKADNSVAQLSNKGMARLILALNPRTCSLYLFGDALAMLPSNFSRMSSSVLTFDLRGCGEGEKVVG